MQFWQQAPVFVRSRKHVGGGKLCIRRSSAEEKASNRFVDENCASRREVGTLRRMHNRFACRSSSRFLDYCTIVRDFETPDVVLRVLGSAPTKGTCRNTGQLQVYTRRSVVMTLAPTCVRAPISSNLS